MAFWQQNGPQVWPRNGTAPVRDAYPLSYTVFAPQMVPPANENPGSTLPSDGFKADPGYYQVNPSFGDHDALAGAIMRVAQADLYTQPPVGWTFPRAGTWEEPGGPIAASRITRLAPTTSAHPGLNLSSGAGPVMQFIAPPVFSVQTTPIYAIGL
jgi:hypothetical protein